MKTKAHHPPKPTFIASFFLGIAQIITWGGSFYLIAVLAAPASKDMGWPQQWIYGSLSLGMLVSGMLSPVVGRMIARWGGKFILSSSGIILGIGLALAATSPNLPCFLTSWIVIGLGMSLGLYDPLFATLGQLYGSEARGAITQITLISGFCTSIVWPFLALLIEHLGWRNACLAYSVLLVVTIGPIYWYALPMRSDATLNKNLSDEPVTPETHRSTDGKIFHLLMAGFTLAAVIMTTISVQLIALLQELNVSLVTAIGIAALIGPSQVAARILEVLFSRNAHPISSNIVSTVMVAIGLAVVLSMPTAAALGIVLYGVGSGIRSIVRATLPLALFGQAQYPVVLGRIARPTLIAQALTPLLGGFIQAHFGATQTMAILVLLSTINIILVILLRLEICK